MFSCLNDTCGESAAAMTYKEEKEAFVSNLQGTSISDLLLCLVIIPVSILLLCAVQGLTKCVHPVQDILILVMPITLGLTAFSSCAPCFLLVEIFAALIICSLRVYWDGNGTTTPLESITYGFVNDTGDINSIRSLEQSPSSSKTCKIEFISLFRGSVLLLTCLSILAIDFHVYPRRFGKTELYGISLMDTGAATFIVASAISSRYARRSNKKPNILQYFFVFCLGIGRMLTLKALNYQEHVSEYGTEWNFFVTLSLVWIIADVVHRIADKCDQNVKTAISTKIPLLCCLILGYYQYLLSFDNLTAFLLFSPRSSFFESNREGFLSLFGFSAMYLLAEWFSGNFIFDVIKKEALDSNSTSKARDVSYSSVNDSVSESRRVLKSLLGSCIICGFVWYTSSLLQPVSRRLTNMPFVFMILCLASLMLAALHLIVVAKMRICPSNDGTSPIKTLECMSAHQLVIFIAANLLTGMINMTIKTLYSTDEAALGIIACYMISIVLLAWACDKHCNKQYKVGFIIK